MRVAFAAPELRRLDQVRSDALCLCLFVDDWPLRGAAGLVDWRVGGDLSRLREISWISCEEGEVVLMPLGRRLPFERLLLFGMGRAEALTDQRIAAGLHRVFTTLGRIRVHAAVVQLPGRPGRVSDTRIMEILASVAREHPEHDEVVLVEPVASHRVMAEAYEKQV